MFIAIEGCDGSGKATQTELLKNYVSNTLGKEVVSFAFPRYGHPSAALVENYLQGELSETADEIAPKVGSTYYALDRERAAPEIRQALKMGKVVICDRYVGSNMAHQGQKFDDDQARQEFFDWNFKLEYSDFGIPKPDLNVVLLVNPEISQQLAEQEDKSGAGKDLHDSDPQHFKRAYEVYQQMCQLYPDSFKPINCSPEGELLSRDAIHQLVVNEVITIQ